jgi:hypothetical protein
MLPGERASRRASDARAAIASLLPGAGAESNGQSTARLRQRSRHARKDHTVYLSRDEILE